MDDFINKVGWGLNLLFSNGVGWPRTRWLVHGGVAHRAIVQVLPAPPPAADAGLVQGLPRARAGRPEAQPAHPRGPGASDDERCASARLAEAAMSGPLPRRTSQRPARRHPNEHRAAGRARRHPGPGALRLQASHRSVVPAPARRRSRRGAALARDGAGHHRRDDRAAARHRAADRAHRRRPARARRRREHRRPASPPSSSPAWPTTPTGRAGSATSAPTTRAAGNGAPARTRPTCWCCSTRCRASWPRSSATIEVQCAAGFERIELPDDERPRRHRAVRLPGRHLAAARRLADESVRRRTPSKRTTRT